MRFLVICHNPASRLMTFVRWLAADHEVILATSRTKDFCCECGMKRIIIKDPNSFPIPESILDCWENVIARAKKARGSFGNLSRIQFKPDIVLVSSTRGDAFEIKEVFPDSLVVNYQDYFFSKNNFIMDLHAELQKIQAAKSDMVYSLVPSKEYQSLSPMVDCSFFNPTIKEEPAHAVIFIDDQRYKDKVLNLAEKLINDIYLKKIIILSSDIEILNNLLLINKNNKIIPEQIKNPQSIKKIYQQSYLIAYYGDILPQIVLEAMSCCVPGIFKSLTIHDKLISGIDFIDIDNFINNSFNSDYLLEIGAKGSIFVKDNYDINILGKMHLNELTSNKISRYK